MLSHSCPVCTLTVSLIIIVKINIMYFSTQKKRKQLINKMCMHKQENYSYISTSLIIVISIAKLTGNVNLEVALGWRLHH